MKTAKLLIVSMVIFFFFSPPVAGVQEAVHASITLSSKTPLIGEPIYLSLTVTVPTATQVLLPHTFTATSTYEIGVDNELTLVSQETFDTYQQDFTLVLWEVGDFQTPELIIKYRLPGSSADETLFVQPIGFSVKSVLNPDDLFLRPLKPPVTLFYVPLWQIGIVGIGIICALYLLLRKRSGLREGFVPQDDLDGLHMAARYALNELRRISHRRLTTSQVYGVVGDTLRQYLVSRFAIPATEFTTTELKLTLKGNSDVPAECKRELTRLLQQIDLTKFANVQPKSSSTANVIDAAQRWIISVEKRKLSIVRSQNGF